MLAIDRHSEFDCSLEADAATFARVVPVVVAGDEDDVGARRLGHCDLRGQSSLRFEPVGRLERGQPSRIDVVAEEQDDTAGLTQPGVGHDRDEHRLAVGVGAAGVAHEVDRGLDVGCGRNRRCRRRHGRARSCARASDQRQRGRRDREESMFRPAEMRRHTHVSWYGYRLRRRRPRAVHRSAATTRLRAGYSRARRSAARGKADAASEFHAGPAARAQSSGREPSRRPVR